MPENIFEFCLDLAEILTKKKNFSRIILGESELSADYTAVRDAVLQNNPWKL
jgi:hypothetical protein